MNKLFKANHRLGVTRAIARLNIVQEAGNGLDIQITLRDPDEVMKGLRDLRVRLDEIIMNQIVLAHPVHRNLIQVRPGNEMVVSFLFDCSLYTAP